MKTKKIMSSGLAFDTNFISKFFSIKYGEEADMERLAKEAKKGWIATDFKGMSFILTESTPQDLIFTIDYKDDPDQDYLDIFRAGGWDHVGSIDYIHLFKAAEGTAPIHSNMDTKLEKLSHEMRRFGMLTLLGILLLFAANAFTVWATDSGIQWLTITALVVNLIALVFLIFRIMPFFGYWSRVRKIKRNKI